MAHERRIDPRALIARLQQESQTLLQRDIIAPVIHGSRIRTRLNGLVYEFRQKSSFSGWGCFRPRNEREAELQREAQPWERGAYLELFPVLRMILLWPDIQHPSMWWAIPFNESDARQRFGMPPEPHPVLLCDPTNGADRFERVLVRVDGRTLWYEGPDLLADPIQAEWLRDASSQQDEVKNFLPGLAQSQRLALLFWQIHRLEVNERQEREQFELRLHQQLRHLPASQRLARLQQERHRSTLEGQLQHALAKANATLHSYSEIPGGQLVVEWSERDNHYRYRSVVNRRLEVISSGICLSGRDRDFDLTSLVNVVSTSPDWAQYED